MKSDDLFFLFFWRGGGCLFLCFLGCGHVLTCVYFLCTYTRIHVNKKESTLRSGFIK